MRCADLQVSPFPRSDLRRTIPSRRRPPPRCEPSPLMLALRNLTPTFFFLLSFPVASCSIKGLGTLATAYLSSQLQVGVRLLFSSALMNSYLDAITSLHEDLPKGRPDKPFRAPLQSRQLVSFPFWPQARQSSPPLRWQLLLP